MDTSIPVDITLCTGTTCYVMGGAELLDDLEGAIDAGEIAARLRGSTCLGHCRLEDPTGDAMEDANGHRRSADVDRGTSNEDPHTGGPAAAAPTVPQGRPPYAVVDGRVVAGATLDRVKAAVAARRTSAESAPRPATADAAAGKEER